MAKKTVEFEIRASGGQTISELKKVGASMDDVARKAKEMAKAGGRVDTRSVARATGMSQQGVERYWQSAGGFGGGPGGAGGVRGLKQSFGAESGIGNAANMLRGAGAVAGVAIAGRLFNDMTKSAEEFVLQFERGNMTAGELAENLARSVPILGNIADGAVRLFGLITGTTQATEKLKAQAASADRATDFTAASLARRKGYAKDQGNTAAALMARNAMVGLEGYEAEAEADRQAQVKARKDASDKLAGDLAKVDAETQKALAKARADKTLDPETRRMEENRIRKAAESEKAERTKSAKEIAAAEAAVWEREQDQKYNQLLKNTDKWLGALNRQERDLRRGGVRAMRELMGDSYSAELQDMITAGEDRKRIFKEQLEEQLKLIPPAMQAVARQRGDAVMGAMDQATTQQIQARMQKTLQESTLATYEKLAAAGDRFAEAEAKRLRRVEALTKEYRTQMAILESAESTPEQKAEARQNIKTMGAREQALVGWELKNQRSSLLQAQSELGGMAGDAASVELAGQGMKDEFDAMAAGVMSILQNPNATPDQKRQAVMQLQALAGMGGQRLANSLPTSAAITPQLTGAESSLLMSGVADSFKNANDPQKKTADGVQEVVKLNKEMGELWKSFMQRVEPLMAQIGDTVTTR